MAPLGTAAKMGKYSSTGALKGVLGKSPSTAQYPVGIPEECKNLTLFILSWKFPLRLHYNAKNACKRLAGEGPPGNQPGDGYIGFAAMRYQEG